MVVRADQIQAMLALNSLFVILCWFMNVWLLFVILGVGQLVVAVVVLVLLKARLAGRHFRLNPIDFVDDLFVLLEKTRKFFLAKLSICLRIDIKLIVGHKIRIELVIISIIIIRYSPLSTQLCSLFWCYYCLNCYWYRYLWALLICCRNLLGWLT